MNLFETPSLAEGDFATSSSYETNKRYVHRNDVETQAFSGVCYWGFQTETQEFPSWLSCPLPVQHLRSTGCVQSSSLWQSDILGFPDGKVATDDCLD